MEILMMWCAENYAMLGQALGGAFDAWGSWSSKRTAGAAMGGIGAGMGAAGSAMGGIFMNKIVAAYINPNPIGTPSFLAGVDWVRSSMSWLNAHRGYESLFVIMACVHPIALLVIWSLRKRQSAA
jgi:hypothetical protein